MGRPFIFKTLLTSILILMLHPVVRADMPMKFLIDTARYGRQEDQKDKGKEKSDQKPVPDKPVIKEVPKARRQTRPPVVVKPNIKVKPIKIIRPRIKKP
jgi:hypothetical protein